MITKLNPSLVLVLLLLFFFQIIIGQNDPTVLITDQNNNTGTVTIDCDYNFKPTKIVELTATFPNLSSTTDYTVQQVTYNTTGNYTDGNPIVFIGDDTWSSNIPIGFNFCFYNNIYSSLNVGDNGIVRFGYDSSIPEGSFSSITNTTPSPSLVRNAIFGGFQDMLNIPVGFGCATGENCGTISYLTIGTAPFRKCIINFNEVNHFNCTGFNGRKSTFQIVLYETTNIIDINVKEKPITCSGNVSANGNSNSLIGLNNASGTLGIAPPNRNTGSWAAIDESYQFIPSGASATTLQWFNAAGTFIGSSNPIDVVPTVDTFYTVRVNYNTCTPQTIQSIINIDFDLNYPVAPNLTRNYCDATLPFPNEIIDVEAELVDPTDLAGTIKTLHNTLAEANLGINPLTGMNAFNMTTTVRTFYYRETIGDCYVTGSITLRLFQTPTIADQEIFICDLDNNNTQSVFLPSLTTQIVGYTSGMTVSYYQNQANAIAGVNPFTTVNVTNPPGFYDVFVRFVNTSNPQCFSVSRLTLRLSPNIELAPVAPFCITNPNFDNQEIFDLTTIPLSIITGPASVGGLTINYFTSLAQANANSNPILNPANYNITINPPATNTTLYISAVAPGFCRTVIPVVISFCEADGGDDGSGGSGGNGGYGGFGACLNTGDPIPSFDLNLVYNAVMLPITPAPTPLGFYTTLLAAQTQDPTFLLTPAEVSNFTPTVIAPELFDEIFVRFTDSNGIPGIRRIILPVKYRQNVNRDIEICDTYNDGNETIDLNPYIQEVELLSPGESVTAFANFADYLANTNPVTSVTIVAPNTIVYIKAASFGCDSNYNFNFILNPYTVNTPILEQVCDIDADGVENYDLSVLYTTILSSYPLNSIVTIHATLNEAFDESNTIPITTTNYAVNPTTNVWFRIEPDPLALPVTCPIIQPIDFDFFNSIDVNPVGTVEYCDVDDDGQVVTSNLNSIITGIVIETPAEPIIKRLYTTLLAAQNNDPVYEILPDWDSFVFDSSVLGANATIYLYLENSVTGCDRIIPINIVMQSFPLNTINTVRVCDFENNGSEVIQDMSVFNAQITANYFLYGFSYFENMSDAVAGTNEIPNNFTISNNTIVYVKITSGTLTDCYRVIPITIEFDESPIVTNAIPLICDNLGDGTEIVNLNSFIDQIVPTPSNYTITYHQLENDALQNLNAFSNFALSNYNVTSFDVTNISVPVFVRITDSNGCFSIARLAFERNSLIEAFDTINFTCDISLTNELQGEFDLPSLVPLVNGTGMIVNPNDYIISYHSNLTQATSGSNPIVNPSNYIVIGDQTSYVFVRFLDPITSCFTVKRIELQIYNLPKFVNSTYDVCDDNLDGIYILDLVNLNGVVVEDPTPFIFEYFNTQADAFAGINQITNFQNYIINVTEFPKTIYVKGTNSNNCSKVKSVIIENKPLVPLLTNTTQIIECDPDNNGVEFFDLTSATNSLTSQTGVTFQYFISLNDLQSNTNPIVNPTNYQNLAPNPSVIYVRLAAPITNCDNWATINLVPFYEEYAFPSNVTFCDNNADGSEIINLTETVYTILSNFNSSSISLAFHTSLADANASINSIADPENYNLTNFSTPLFVRITNIATGCPIVKQLFYTVPQPIVLTTAPIVLCDYDRNNVENITLSNYFNQLNSNFNNYTITSYLSENDALNSSNSISNTNYEMSLANQTFWVRFEDAFGCYSITSISLQIDPLPNPLLNPSIIALCDDTNQGDLIEIFDLTTNASYILNGTNDLISYHTSVSDAENGLNPINNPTSYSSSTATIWIRVTKNPASSVSNCAVIIEQELKVNALPIADLPSNYYSCMNPNSNQAPFQLDTKNNEILNGQNPALFTVTYHLSQQEAKQGINLLPNSYLSASQTIWASVRNNTTNCRNTSPLNLIAEPFTIANAPLVSNTTKCDEDGLNDGFTIFDLSLLNSEVLGLNQSTNYTVDYYESLSNLNANIAIANVSTFENTSNPQMIYAKVTNLNTVNRCDAIVSFPLQVNRLPEPLINDGYVCYDQNNNQLIQSYTLDTQLNQNTHTFEWYFNTTLIANEQNASLEVSNPGDYFVIATNIQTGCISEPFSATVTRSEPANFTTRVEYSFNDTVAIIVSATGLGNYSYQLNNEIAQSSPIFENVAPGTHQIRVYDLYGCNDTFAEVIVLNYTKFFTPNGDGYNDHWQIQGIYDQPDAKIYIYDRYGKLLKQLNPREIGWDGTYGGNKLPSTDYWFTVTYMENGEQKEFKSHFAMKR